MNITSESHAKKPTSLISRFFGSNRSRNPIWSPINKFLACTAAIVLTVEHQSFAIIFPQQSAPYDPDQGTISYQDAWNAGHAIVLLKPGDAPAVAIHSNWVITAGHWGANFTQVRVPGIANYDIVDHVAAPSGADARIFRVNSTLPVYSQYRTTPVSVNDEIVAYGESFAAGDPITDSSGNIRAWKWGTDVQTKALRRGRGIVSYSLDRVTWPFTSALQDCAGAAYYDSGGGVFLGTELAGVLVSKSVESVSPDSTTPCGVANVFDSTGLHYCAGIGLTTSTATQMSWISDWIDDTLAAPVVTIQGYYPVYEGGADGGFMLSRTGSTAQALTVYVQGISTHSGDAVMSADYDSVGTWVIPAGYSSSVFPINWIDDSYPEGTETVRIQMVHPSAQSSHRNSEKKWLS